MIPTLLTIGPISIKTLNLFLFFALLTSWFVIWRKIREEHYDEVEVFDALLLSTVWGLLSARVVFILSSWPAFGFNPISWIDIFGHAGIHLTTFFVVSAWSLFRFAKDKRWDAFEILDFWSIGSSAALVWVWMGYFLAGINFGNATQLAWGMIFPGTLQPHTPVQLFFVGFYIALTSYLSWAEFRYRTFVWYRFKKHTAQTGFLISVFLLLSSLWSLLLSFFMPSPLTVFSIRFDMFLSAFGFVWGAVLLFLRSGRSFPRIRFGRKDS